MEIFTIPNLLKNSIIKKTYIINQSDYFINFEWRRTFCLISIYTIIDGKEVYLTKGRALTINSDLIGRVNDPDLIEGSLYLMHKYGENIEPTQETLHSDYYLVWIGENE